MWLGPLLLTATALAGGPADGEVAPAPLDREAYADRFALVGRSHPGWADIQRCLDAWEDHPFHGEDVRFRMLRSSTRVMGFGTEIHDDAPTTYPQLVLVKPSVNVMTRTTYRLDNPNGWYCFAGSVTILGNHRIVAACGAHLAHVDGATLKPGAEGGGTAILGTIEVIQEDCDRAEAAAPAGASAQPPPRSSGQPAATVDERPGWGELRWGDAPDARYVPAGDRGPLPASLEVRVAAAERDLAARGELEVAGQPVDTILYGFNAGRFTAYAIHPASPEALAALRAALERKYGPSTGDTWRGERVELSIRDGWLVYTYLPGMPAASPAVPDDL